MTQEQKWVTLATAAAEYGVVKSTISRIVKRHHVATRPDTVDSRLLLVDYQQLRQVMSSSVKYDLKHASVSVEDYQV